MKRFIAMLAPALLVAAGCAFGQTTDDVMLLAQKGVGEEVMTAFVTASPSVYNLTAEEIVKLKDAKVPDKVVLAMLRHKPAVAQTAQVAAAQEAAPPVIMRRHEAPAPAEFQPQPVRERIIERQQVVETPQTTVVYSGSPDYAYYPTYVYPSYSYSGSYWPSYSYGGYYRSSYCYPSFSGSFSLGHGFRGSIYSGIGGGFHSGGGSHGGGGFASGGFHSGRR